MAEKIISPGVFTNEIDQTFLPSAVADIGAAIIGPTVKGPAGIPTVVTSYSDFQNKFGDVVTSGSNKFQFLTSHAAEEYLKNSDTLTVVRIMDGAFSPATANIGSRLAGATSAISCSDGDAANGVTEGQFIRLIDASGSIKNYVLTDTADGGVATGTVITSASDIGDATAGDTAGCPTENAVAFAINKGSDTQHATLTALKAAIEHANGHNGSIICGTIPTQADGMQAFTISQLHSGSDGNLPISESLTTLSLTAGNAFAGGKVAFQLKTVADGTIMNNAGFPDAPNDANADSQRVSTNGVLQSGSVHNIRYEVSNVNNKKGTFTLAIRAGNDNNKRKQTLETFTGINLDPNSPSYIGKAIGDQRQTFRTDDGVAYIQLSGSFPNKSKFVTVHNITNTVDYLDENGNVRVPAASMSLPNVGAGSGSRNGGFLNGSDGHSGFDALGIQGGTNTSSVNFYDLIDGTDSQGFAPTDLTGADGGSSYSEALDLLKNQDEFDINLILTPGLIHNVHSAVTNKVIDVCEDRGDCFAIIDPVLYGKNVSHATTEAEAVDSNFAAMYWPWVKVPDSQVAGTQRWVPPSVVLGGIYAFNDRVAHPWFAPAGLNRGGITTAIQAERKLTQGNRDTLYDSNVNPIATFPGQGVTVFGQKTLQKKNSALDRINVRRLLIRVKKFIASSSRFLVFEQNTASTRRRFLGIVNPFLENVQSQSGLNAFRVVMDETNNTPDTIDRNQLVGQLFLQPTRTAEFIVLDFTVQPTGASFPE